MEQNEMTSRIMDAMRAPRYSDVRDSDRLSGLARLLYDEFARKGQGSSGADELAYRLDRDLADYYGRQLTLPEVLLALRWGLRGEYGDFTGLNADRLFRFVRAYMESEARRDALRSVQSRPQSPAAEEDREAKARESWEMNLRCARRAWEDWRRLGFLPGAHRERIHDGGFASAMAAIQTHTADIVYRWLKRLGFVACDPATSAAESDCMAWAREQVRRYPERYGTDSSCLAGALMLERLFAAGNDFNAVLADVEETPEEERREYDFDD